MTRNRRIKMRQKAILSGVQDFYHRDFPDGKRIVRCDLAERVLVIEDPETGDPMEVLFDYTSEGASVECLATAPDGTGCGGTSFPMCFLATIRRGIRG